MSPIIVIATQDGHWLARCRQSGKVASGRTVVEATAALSAIIAGVSV